MICESCKYVLGLCNLPLIGFKGKNCPCIKDIEVFSNKETKGEKE